MNYSLHTISESNIDLVESNPAIICLVIDPEPDMYLDFNESGSDEIPDIQLTEGETKKLNVSWDPQITNMIRFCLTKQKTLSVSPIDFIITGGFDTNIELGCSTVRLVRVSELKSILNELKALSNNIIGDNFDSGIMQESNILTSNHNSGQDPQIIGFLEKALENLKSDLEYCVDYNVGIYIQLL